VNKPKHRALNRGSRMHRKCSRETSLLVKILNIMPCLKNNNKVSCSLSNYYIKTCNILSSKKSILGRISTGTGFFFILILHFQISACGFRYLNFNFLSERPEKGQIFRGWLLSIFWLYRFVKTRHIYNSGESPKNSIRIIGDILKFRPWS